MLDRYREGRHSEDENNLAHTLEQDGLNSAKDSVEVNNAPKVKTWANESVKPPGVEEDEESDEDLSYLL